MVAAGEVAPSFALLSDTEEKVSLAQYHGKTVIVYFYPKANTGG